MIGLIIAAAPVQVQNYRIVGRVSPKEAISSIYKKIDTREARFPKSASVYPFMFADIYLDSAPNQYTLWGSSHRSLWINGDTIGVAFRRIETSPGSGRIGAAWSFNNGVTWNVRGNINYDAGLAGAGGRYPNFAGFTSTGLPVVSWPELIPGPAWGKACIAVVATTPYGYCYDGTASGDSVYHTHAWKVAPDTFAVVGFTTGNGVIGFLYDAVSNNATPAVKLRDPGLAEDLSLYDISLHGDTLIIAGNNSAEGDGIVKVYKNGTTLATSPVPPSAGGPSVVERHLLCCWTITIGSRTFTKLGYAAYSFTMDRFGRGWSIYAMKDTSADPSQGPGHIIVLHRWDDSSLVIFAPWTGSGVQVKNPVYWPRFATDLSPTNLTAFWIQYLDTANYGCATGTQPFQKSIFYATTSDGGTSWFIQKATNESNLADFFFPAAYRGGNYMTYNNIITGVYLTPRGSTTDLYCNVIANNATSAYLHVVRDTLRYSTGYPGDTIIVGVDEKGKGTSRIVLFKNAVSVSGSAVIYDARGSLVRKVNGSAVVRLGKGVYFIRTGGRVYKVVIR